MCRYETFASLFWSIRFRQLAICVDLARSLRDELHKFARDLLRTLWPLLSKRTNVAEPKLIATPPDELLARALRVKEYNMVSAEETTRAALNDILELEKKLNETAIAGASESPVEQREAAFVLMAVDDFDAERAQARVERECEQQGERQQRGCDGGGGLPLLDLARRGCFDDAGACLTRPPAEWLSGEVPVVGPGGVRLDMIAAKIASLAKELVKIA